MITMGIMEELTLLANSLIFSLRDEADDYTIDALEQLYDLSDITMTTYSIDEIITTLSDALDKLDAHSNCENRKTKCTFLRLFKDEVQLPNQPQQCSNEKKTRIFPSNL